jgi:hypothetical protein
MDLSYTPLPLRRTIAAFTRWYWRCFQCPHLVASELYLVRAEAALSAETNWCARGFLNCDWLICDASFSSSIVCHCRYTDVLLRTARHGNHCRHRRFPAAPDQLRWTAPQAVGR